MERAASKYKVPADRLAAFAEVYAAQGERGAARWEDLLRKVRSTAEVEARIEQLPDLLASQADRLEGLARSARWPVAARVLLSSGRRAWAGLALLAEAALPGARRAHLRPRRGARRFRSLVPLRSCSPALRRPSRAARPCAASSGRCSSAARSGRICCRARSGSAAGRAATGRTSRAPTTPSAPRPYMFL